MPTLVGGLGKGLGKGKRSRRLRGATAGLGAKGNVVCVSVGRKRRVYCGRPVSKKR
jgi:hypothetical protein